MKIAATFILCAIFSLSQSAFSWSVEEMDMESEAQAKPADVRAVASRGTEPRIIKSGNGTISMDLVDAALEDVLKLLSQQAGLNFVAAQAVRDKRVTVYMDRVPIQTAIRSLLDANNLTFHPIEGSDVFIVTDAGGRAIKLMTKVYTLKFARVLPTLSESAKKFGGTGSLITTTFSSSSTSSTSGQNAGSNTQGSTGAGIGGGEESEDKGIVSVIKQLVTERGTVTIDPRTNSIIVMDVAESFPAIDEVIAKLDVKPTQLMLEAEVLEVSLATLKRLGIEYGDSTGELAAYTGPERGSFFPLAGLRRTNDVTTTTAGTLDLTNFSAVLKAIATDSDTKFLASPRLMTLSNEVAEIRIVSDAATGLTTSSQTQTGTINEEIERNTVGTILRITPLVTENKYVTMVIEPEVSRVLESSKFTDFLDPNRRAARTTVMVENGGTAMIAGLISHDREVSKRKIPILGDIPILGAPFRRTSNTDTQTEIVIFITPRIVSTEGPVPASDWAPIPVREQSPLSNKDQINYRKYRSEIMRQKSIQEAIDMLAKP